MTLPPAKAPAGRDPVGRAAERAGPPRPPMGIRGYLDRTS